MYKLNIFIFIFILISFDVYASPTLEHLQGKVELYKDAGMFFSKIITNERYILELGSPGAMQDIIRECICEAANNNLLVNLTVVRNNIREIDKILQCDIIRGNSKWGPDILGLQLGMTRDEVLDNIKKLQNIDESIQFSEEDDRLKLFSSNDDILGFVDFTRYQLVSNYTLYVALLKKFIPLIGDKNLFEKRFLQYFVDKYHTPLTLDKDAFPTAAYEYKHNNVGISISRIYIGVIDLDAFARDL